MRVAIAFLIAWYLVQSTCSKGLGSYRTTRPEYHPNMKIIYKIIPEPIRIEREIPVVMEKEVPFPVLVYVPQPYPVIKKVFVPYNMYWKQMVPVIKANPMKKKSPRT